MSRKLFCYKKRDFDEIAPDLYKTNKDARFISITSTKGFTEEGLELHILPSSPRVLNLEFDDCTEKLTDDDSTTWYPINEAQAVRIYEFIDTAPGDIYIHCLAGKSRSQAVTRFAYEFWPDRHYTLREENPCITPNPEVLRLCKRVYYLKNKIYYDLD